MEEVETNGLIRLNVGGTWYTTTNATLLTFQDSIFPKMLAQRNNNNKKLDDDKGYYFIDRDGALFRYVLNYMRTSQLKLPSDFQERNQLISEAEFYGLRSMANLLKSGAGKPDTRKCTIIEVVETAHPEKIGVCSSRLVLTEELRHKSPFYDVIENLPSYYNEEYRGHFGRFWIRTNIPRLEWAEKLRGQGWQFMGTTSLCRKLPDITGQGTDLCHVIEKWCLYED